MAYDLRDIKEIRKKSGLTQGQLANKAGVSQSLIAKIESGRLDPTYTKTTKIFEALENISSINITRAREIMNTKIIPIKSSDQIKDAIKKMKKYGISQMPVIDHNVPIGLITESDIINKFSEIDNPIKLNLLTVEDVMQECPPNISQTSSSKAIRDLLLHYSVILVSNKGKLVGLITKADMLDRIYKA